MIKPQVNAGHYNTSNYITRERLNSYLYQINEVLKLKPDSVLEIGTGNGFVANYLKYQGINLTTFDLDEGLKPDKVGSVLSLPFEPNALDLIACFQVLEHLKYEDFKMALKEIFRVTKDYAVISLPDAERCFKLAVEKNNCAILKKYIEIPRHKKPKHKFDGEHYWEIGKDGFPLQKIFADIRKSGFNIVRTYRLFENVYHRLFVLRKDACDKKTNKLSLYRLGNLESWREFHYEENFNIATIMNKIGRIILKKLK